MTRHGAACAAAIAILMPLGPSAGGRADDCGVHQEPGQSGGPLHPHRRRNRGPRRESPGVQFHPDQRRQRRAADRRWPKRRCARSRTRWCSRRPIAKALVPIVSKFTAAGIPVVNVNDRLAGGNAAAYVGSDDRGDRARHRARAAQGDERHRHGRDPGRTAQRSRRARCGCAASTRRSRNFRT